MKKFVIGIVVLAVCLVGILLFRQKSAFNQIKKIAQHKNLDHIVVIVLENKTSGDIVKNPQAPFINSLINKFSYLANYYAVSHPSLPNYLALIGGDTFNISSDCTNCFVHSPSLIDQLESAHISWKAYMESIPSNCYVGNLGEYAQKHNPFIYFDNIRTNVNRCQNIASYNNIKSDFSSLSKTPNFAWITPNLCNDMHDCSINTGDKWLSNQVSFILSSPAFKNTNSLLIITFDEGEGSGSNKVATILVGNTVKKGFTSQVNYSHYSLLHTIENNWNLLPLTQNVSKSNFISDVFVK